MGDDESGFFDTRRAADYLGLSPRTLTEGDASDTATLTVSLDRRLYAGETIGVPIALTTSTGARLPGSVDTSNVANHDFEVSAAAASMHSGVTLASALTANPRVVFTGHDTNTVQTATVTLTPVANRDDGDAAHETITATITSLGACDLLLRDWLVRRLLSGSLSLPSTLLFYCAFFALSICFLAVLWNTRFSGVEVPSSIPGSCLVDVGGWGMSGWRLGCGTHGLHRRAAPQDRVGAPAP